MAEGKKPRFKLQSERVDIPIAKVRATTLSIFEAHGCGPDEASDVTDHLINADQSSVESHGVVRVLQYELEYRSGVLIPGAPIEIIEDNDNRRRLDAGSGIGIRAMRKAVEAATERAQRHGLAMVTLTGADHTGRLGAFAHQPLLHRHSGRHARAGGSGFCHRDGRRRMDLCRKGGWRGPAAWHDHQSERRGNLGPQRLFRWRSDLAEGGPHRLGPRLDCRSHRRGHVGAGKDRRDQLDGSGGRLRLTCHARGDARRRRGDPGGSPYLPISERRRAGRGPRRTQRDRAASLADTLSLPVPIWDRLHALERSGEGKV